MAGSSRRVAIIGASGQVGYDLMHAFDDWRPVGLTHQEIEVADARSVDDRLGQIGPEVVVNCAAFHRVNECETEPAKAFLVNALGAWNVARTAARLGARAVYISTDYVFGGDVTRPYVESDEPAPINVYGASKLAAERLVAASAPRHLIVRIASVFGVAGARGKGGNFIETMIEQARAGVTMYVGNDLCMSPTYGADAAAAIRILVASGAEGTVHATNAGSCTWFALARALFDMLGWQVDLRPRVSGDEPGVAPRPRNSALTSIRLPEFGIAAPSWQDGLRRYLVAKHHLSAPAPVAIDTTGTPV